MTETHQEFKDNLAAYALGALDADEFAALETHLQTCDSCRAELMEYERVSAGLLSALSPQAPHPVLKRTLQSHLPGAQPAISTRWQAKWSFGQLAGATALVLLLVLNVFSLLQTRALQQQQAALTQRLQTEQTALAMLSYPGAETLPVSGEGVAGSLLIDRDRNTAVLFVWNLPTLDTNKTYQIWLIDAQGGRVSAGLFNAESGQPFTTAMLSSPDEIGKFSGVGVTVEPRGGSPHPTGQKVLGVDL